MLKCLAVFRPDVVYMALTATWSGFLRDAVLACMAKLFNARVIGHVHGGWFDKILLLNGIKGRIVRFSLKRFDALLMLGEPWRQLIASYGYAGIVRIVPSMFRQELATAAAGFERYYNDVKEARGLFVGHVGPGKGILDLLTAVASLRKRGKQVRIIITGPPQFAGDWDLVTKKCAELNLRESVEFTGPLEGEPLYDQFRRADFFILPSHFEGFPVVILEAGLFGLPVITTPVGAISDLIHSSENGLLVSPGDVQSLETAIDQLTSDRALRQKLGVQLKKDVGAYSPEFVCARIAEVVDMVK
jgi:glycosyltransferase involved in cell wall biosynthesis